MFYNSMQALQAIGWGGIYSTLLFVLVIGTAIAVILCDADRKVH